jgi:hypothetical protein
LGKRRETKKNGWEGVIMERKLKYGGGIGVRDWDMGMAGNVSELNHKCLIGEWRIRIGWKRIDGRDSRE